MSIEVKGLGNFERKLLQVATRELPKESLRIVRKMGTRARTMAAKKGRAEVGNVSGTYRRGWKLGKAFKRGSAYMIYVKNLSPHAHLIEDGHRIVGNDGKEHGFQEGKHVLQNSMKEFEDTEMDQILEKWLDDLLGKGL